MQREICVLFLRAVIGGAMLFHKGDAALRKGRFRRRLQSQRPDQSRPDTDEEAGAAGPEDAAARAAERR